MDSNAAVAKLRTLMNGLRNEIDGTPDDREPVVTVENVSEAIDVWDGLDEWLSKGGFLPSMWERAR